MRPDEILDRINNVKLSAKFENNLLMNRSELMAGLEQIRGVPGMNRRLASLETLIPTDPMDPIKNDAINQITGCLSSIHQYRSNLIEFLKTTYENDSETTFYLRLPDTALSTPQEFARCFEDLIIRLDELCVRIAQSGLTIGGLRHGSAWIQIVAAPEELTAGGLTIGAAAVVIALIRLYYWCRMKDAECRKILAEAKTTEAGQKLQEGIIEMFEQLKHQQASNMLMALHSDHTRPNLHENVNLGLAWLGKLAQYSHANAKIMLSARANEAIKSEVPIDAGGHLSELSSALVPEQKALAGASEGPQDN